MMHQDGSRHQWLASGPMLDLIVTMDDATSTIYSAFLIEEERVVARDNTVAFARLRLQLPKSPIRHHFVKATVKIRQYPDGTLAVFHGPRRIARYMPDGAAIEDTCRIRQVA